jgi:hypothetical protein
MPWVKTHYSEGEYREWRQKYQGVSPQTHWQVRSEEKCTDCGFLYLAAKLGALFFWKEDRLAPQGKHGVCMNSACRRSLWGGYPTPRVLLGEYYARHGVQPPCAMKSIRSLFQLTSKIPSEGQRAERKASKEAIKRRRGDRGGRGWNAQPAGGRSNWHDWAASDGHQSAAASSGGGERVSRSAAQLRCAGDRRWCGSRGSCGGFQATA